MARHKAATTGAPAPRTYKLIELVGTSAEGFEQAIQNAVRECSKSLRALAWFEVVEQRGALRDGAVVEYQVKVKLAFRVLDGE